MLGNRSGVRKDNLSVPRDNSTVRINVIEKDRYDKIYRLYPPGLLVNLINF